MKKVGILFLTILLVTVFFVPVSRAETGNVVYVSPTGDDQGDGSEQAPFQTLAKAVSVMQAGDTCYLRGGVYREVLKPKSNTTLLAYPGEQPVVSACDPLADWEYLGNQLYAASMNWTLGDQNMVLVDGAFAYEARWPDNTGSLCYPIMSSITYINSSDRTKFTDRSLPEGIDPVGATLWICGGKRWIFWNRKVTAFDPESKTITFNAPFAATANAAYDPAINNPYVLMGKREFLSCQNEWYYEPTEKKLILWSSRKPASMDIEAKKRTETLDLSGVSNVTIEGITFTGGRITSSANTRYCTLRGITSLYAAHSFLRNVQGNQIKGHHNLIENSEFAYASFTVLQDTGSDNRYINNLFRDINYNANFIGSVNLAGSRALFSHNTVRDGGRELLTLHHGKASLIQYNDLYHSSTVTWDTAAIYVNMTDGNNTVIRYNTVHDTISSSLGMGIYFDPCTQNYIVYGNVIWNMTDSAIRLNNPANYILVYQNSAYKTGPMSTVCSGNRINGDLYGSRFINNIFDGSTVKNYPNNTVFQYNIVGKLTLAAAKWDYKMEAVPFEGTTEGTVAFRNPEQGDLRLEADDPALSAGTSLPGVSNGQYIGAYAAGAPLLDTGRHIGRTYDETYEFPNVIHMNRVRNGGFGYGDLRYWNTEGENVSLVADSSWSSATAKSRAGSYGVSLGAGTNAITQKITGLSKNTVYTLSGWARAGSGSTVTMGVREIGGTSTFTEDAWNRKYFTFNTGDRTEVTVYYQSEGTGVSYCGDMGLSQPTLMSEEAAEAVAKATLEEDLEKLSQSDLAFYKQPTVEAITFAGDTAQVTLVNTTGKSTDAQIQAILYRAKGQGTKEYLSMERIPVTLPAGTESAPVRIEIPVPLPRPSASCDYYVKVRVMDFNLLTPLGKSEEVFFQAE